MSIKRILKKPSKRIPRNEWLAVIASLDELMAKQASQEVPKLQKPQFDRGIVTAVNSAYAATLRYYTALIEGGRRDQTSERELSRVWQKAGMSLKRYDADLASRLKGSNEFWANDVTWEKETIQKAWACLNSIRISANSLAPDSNTVQRWSTFSSS